jgi:hypothetical protein
MSAAAFFSDKVRSLSLQSALKVGRKALNIATGIRSNFKVICTISRFLRQGVGTTNNCANEDYKQFTRHDPTQSDFDSITEIRMVFMVYYCKHIVPYAYCKKFYASG